MTDLETRAAHYARLAAEGWADPDLPAACSAQVTADGGRAVAPEQPDPRWVWIWGTVSASDEEADLRAREASLTRPCAEWDPLTWRDWSMRAACGPACRAPRCGCGWTAPDIMAEADLLLAALGHGC
jgi:hypothetical protein